MARPIKNNADYFSHDNDMRDDERIKAVRRKFSHIGYSTWNMLLERLCRADNFKIEYQEDNLDIMAGDFSIEPEQLKEIINYLIFLKLIIQDGKLIFSQTMITRFEGLFKKRKRETDKLSSAITTTEQVIADDNTQSKVNNSKVNETKEKEMKEKVDMEKPPIFLNSFSEEKNFGKKEIVYADCIEPCQLIFLQSSPEYAWAQRDTEQLVQLLQKIIQTKKFIQSEDELIKSFAALLQKLPEYWRTKKFTLPHLNNNYNEIVSEIGATQVNNQVKKQTSQATHIPQQAEPKRELTPEEKIKNRKNIINSICESYATFVDSGSYGLLPLWVMYETLIAEKIIKPTDKKLQELRDFALEKRKSELRKPKNNHETKIFQAMLENFGEEMQKENEKNRIEKDVKTLAVQGLFEELKNKKEDIKTLFKN
ncbi:MAG: DUF4373 domain-containing protein [Bacteroidia bacterium]